MFHTAQIDTRWMFEGLQSATMHFGCINFGCIMRDIPDISLPDLLTQIAEIACSEAASAALNDVSSRTKIPGLHMAAAVPGVCHEHPPTTCLVEGCAYCARNGNVFASADRVDAGRADIVGRYVREVEKTLADLAKTIALTLERDRNVAVDATKAALADLELENMLMDALDEQL